MIKVMTHIYRHEGGIRALYRGLSPTCIGVAPYVAVNFAVYENMKLWFAFDGKPPSVFVKLFCGGMAGAVAQTLTYPLDLLRRRFQIMNIPGHTEFQYKSTLDGLMQIVKREGVPGLYKGCWPNYLKVAPAIAVSFVTYEQSKVWLEQLLH
jgi:solute carrier family 25 phosphate transporter 23/24/25/41